MHNTCSPGKRAERKGYVGIKSTKNGGVDFRGTDYVYKRIKGGETIVDIEMSGSRRGDVARAFDAANISPYMRKYIQMNYTWHHLDNFDPLTNRCTMQLVLNEAHVATYPHIGAVAQYEKYYGVIYN